MTEGSDDGNNLVRVRAQVMMRDDSTGGWVPMGGGGLSNVSVRKRILQTDPDENKPEYSIIGKRLNEETIVLSCVIKKDFQYNKVMPTFHHWRSGNHKFGLTFQTAADARAFDKGVRLAVADIILDGLNEFPSYRYGLNASTDVGDDDVFMAVHLPMERDGSRSSSGSVTTCSSGSRHTPTTTPLTTPDLPLHHHHLHHLHQQGGGGTTTPVATNNTSPSSTISNPTINPPFTNPPSFHHHLHRMTYMPPHRPKTEQSDHDKIQVQGEPYSYVQFAKNQPPHEYSYPLVEGISKGGERRDSITSLKKQQQLELKTPAQQMAPALLPAGKRPRKRDRRNRKLVKVRCRHCNDIFVEDYNSRGNCEYAPDYMKSAIDKLSCISCAECMLYHCMSDAEGEFPHHPCECTGGGGVTESCGRRWLGLTLLSILVPCLWCYLPLRACHRCSVSCGMCGGKHEAS